jgi:MOSC domain-containing protein YiiM
MTTGTLLEIWTARSAGATMNRHDSIEALTDQGLADDRYTEGNGSYSKPGNHPDRQVTLIEQEQLDWLHNEHGLTMTGRDSRRNLLTQGVRLNDLIGTAFRIGDVELLGLRLCQPCKALSERLGFDFVNLMLHRSGLNCRIIFGGTLTPGDVISVA